MRRLAWKLLMLVLVVGLVGCSSGAPARQSLQLSRVGDLEPATEEKSALAILPGCLVDNPQQIQLTADWQVDSQTASVDIAASELLHAKAVYFRLPVPAGAYVYSGIEPGNWAGDGALALAVKTGPGEMQAGIAMVQPQEQPGFSGSTHLATLHFTAQQGTPEASHVASAAPVSQASQIDLDYSPLGNRFMWYYRNEGDYDQNGEVGITDLTPLAKHFGKSAAGGFALESMESVVDGDGNGEINIADLVPISVGFGRKLNAFNIYRSTPEKYPASPVESSTIPMQQIIPFSETSTLPGEARLYYEVESTGSPDPAPAYWLRPADNGSEGIASLIAGNGNQPPDVQLKVTPSLPLAQQIVTFDASATSDLEGGPLVFQWLVFETGTIPSLDDLVVGEPIRQLALDAGSYQVVVLVTDDDGALALNQQLLVVADNPGWLSLEIDVEISDSQNYAVQKLLDLDLTEVDGNPWLAFVYETQVGGARCGLLRGNGLASIDIESIQQLDAEGNSTGAQMEILPADGGCHVFCLLNQSLSGRISQYWVQASDYDVSDRHTVVPPLSLVQGMTATLVDGRPSVAFHDETVGDLRFVQADDAQGVTWPAAVVLDSLGDTGEQAHMLTENGAPFIAYYTPGGLRIRIVNSSLAGGVPQWGVPFTLAPLPGAILGGLMFSPDNEKWLLVHDTAASQLISASGTSLQNSAFITATSGSDNDLFDSAVINGRTCIAWYDRAAQTIKFLRSLEGAPAAWEAPQEIATGLLAGGLTLASIDGHAAMAWFDGVQQTVTYSVLAE